MKLRPYLTRFSAFLLVLGSLVAVPARPAQAAEFHFRRTFTLSEAGLMDFDAFGAYWFFMNGQFVLDVDASISSNGDCFVAAAGSGSGSGLNYKLGTGASLSVFFFEFADCHIDPVDGVLRAKVPFCLSLIGPGGGELPSEMRLAITPSGVEISGVTLGTNSVD
jgi:hypothetical protein